MVTETENTTEVSETPAAVSLEGLTPEEIKAQLAHVTAEYRAAIKGSKMAARAKAVEVYTGKAKDLAHEAIATLYTLIEHETGRKVNYLSISATRTESGTVQLGRFTVRTSKS